MGHCRRIAAFGLAAVAGLAGPGCFGQLDYACSDAAQCRRGSVQGVCEAAGYCSFSDDDCASRRRYTEFAPSDLADRCVGEPSGATETFGTSADSAEPPTTLTTQSNESGAVSTCGDGTQDADETCDDGNDRNGDGCNNDCEPSGRELWAAVFDDRGAEETWRAVSASGEFVAVAGRTAQNGTDADALVAGYSADGTARWSASFAGTAGDDDQAHAVLAQSDGGIVVAGTVRHSAPLGTAAWVQAYDDVGAVRWTGGFDAVADEGIAAIGADATQAVVVAGVADDQGWNARFESDGTGAWAEFIDGPGGAPTEFRSLVVLAGGQFTTVGHSEGAVWLATFGPEGSLLRVGPIVQPALFEPLGLAQAGDTFVIVGSAADRGVVARYSPAGAIVGSSETPGGAGLAAAVAVDGAGDIVAVGETPGTDGRDAWVAKYDPAGTLRWEACDTLEGDDAAWAVAVDDDDAIYVAGTISMGGNADGWLRKLAP